MKQVNQRDIFLTVPLSCSHSTVDSPALWQHVFGSFGVRRGVLFASSDLHHRSRGSWAVGGLGLTAKRPYAIVDRLFGWNKQRGETVEC